MKALAFDVFGTLLDPAALAKTLSDVTKDPDGFAAAWRAKQLESTFLLAAMGRYVPFVDVTRRALRTTAARWRVALTDERVDSLVAAWTRLPPYPDVVPSLERLRERVALAVLSNGDAEALGRALDHAGVGGLLAPVVSAAEVRRFKPAPELYAHAAERLARPPHDVVLVSAHAFDVLGAKSAGLRAVWVNRLGAPLDDLGLGPDLEVPSLRDLTAEDVVSIA
ncbi:MAG: haloacid dehalogenase type II [Methanobacteriota archaeon]